MFFFKRDHDHQRNWIIELLVHQGVALLDKNIANYEHLSDDSLDELYKSPLMDELKFVYRSLLKWTDINDEKVLNICSVIRLLKY